MTIEELKRLAEVYGWLEVDLDRLNGNAFTIDAVVEMQARRQGWPDDAISLLRAEFVSGHMMDAARAVCRRPHPAEPPTSVPTSSL